MAPARRAPLRLNPAALALAGVIGSAARPAAAADTVEPFGAGATDLEAYLSMELGSAALEGVESEVVLGYGLSDRIAAYVAAEHTFDLGRLALVDAMPHVGAFGTLVETDAVDLDLLLDLGLSAQDLELVPALELNLDQRQDQQGAGLYLRAGLPLAGSMLTRPGRQHDAEEEPLTLEITAGAYVGLAEGHQLLAELDSAPAFDSSGAGVAGVALGYNALLSDDVELITQIYFEPHALDMPTVSLGVIVTLPGE